MTPRIRASVDHLEDRLSLSACRVDPATARWPSLDVRSQRPTLAVLIDPNMAHPSQPVRLLDQVPRVAPLRSLVPQKAIGTAVDGPDVSRARTP